VFEELIITSKLVKCKT